MSVATDTRAAADFPVPTGREEAWRFTPLARLRGLHGDAAEHPVAPVVSVDPAPEVSVDVVPAGAVRRTLTAVDRPSALALDGAPEVVVITIPAEARASRPTVVRITGAGAAMTSYGHVLVEAAPFSSSVIVLEHVGSATYSGNVEVRLGDSSEVLLISLQDWADDTVHLGRQHAVLGRDSRFRSFVATFGGDLVRLVPTVEYAAPGGDAELLGVFFADAGQHLEHRSFVDHAVPHCRSNVAYKGALKGDPGAGEAGIARSVWVGDVLIRAAAVGTDTYELNRNLVLTEAARADSVPNLEIETGEISGAGHASATGRFDDEQLFYLQSRGIPADVATRLVVRGFFADVISRLGVPEWEIRLQDRIDAELGLEATGPLDDGPDDDTDTAGSDA
jgi:Fe-S cluster assembly protein SufD